MARLEARMRLGYYPLDEREAQRIARYIHCPAPASVLDPCAGTGAALKTIVPGANIRRYGIELDAYRAAEAKQALDEVIQGDAFNARAPVESFSLLYLNPPYDFEIGEGRNQRMEKLFLDEFFRWLKPGGILVMVVPFDRLHSECRTVLSTHFKDKAIYRLTEPAAQKYKQAVLFGTRRSHPERAKLNDHSVNQANWKLHELTVAPRDAAEVSRSLVSTPLLRLVTTVRSICASNSRQRSRVASGSTVSFASNSNSLCFGRLISTSLGGRYRRGL